MANELLGRLTSKRLEKYTEILNEEPKLKEFLRCANDIDYFLENYYKIVSVDEGLMQYPPREWQKDVCKLMVENKMVLAVCSRRIGKTTLVSGILLWYMLFNNNTNICMMANKFSRAKEVITAIDTAYTYLPDFLKMPYTKRNTSEIVLINESRIKAFPTSADALRGESPSIVFIDEFAFLPQHVMKEFMASTYPTITTGTTTKFLITTTPNGLNICYDLYKQSLSKQNGFVSAIYDYRAIPEHDNEEWRQSVINDIGSLERFQVEFECKFLTSTTSVFNFSILSALKERLNPQSIKFNLLNIGFKIFTDEFKEIIESNEIETDKSPEIFSYDASDIYNNLAKNKMGRIITIDTSEGVGQNYSVANFLKLDYERKKIVQEAQLRVNTLDIDTFAGYIYGIGKILGFPLLIFESNNKSGGEFKRLIMDVYGYSNIIYDRRKKDWGIYTTNLNKNMGLKTLITLLELDIIELNDEDVLTEFNYFERKSTGKFGAESGYTDDIIMSLIIFCYVYQKEKELFGLLFGKEFVIDFLLNPALLSNDAISSDQNTIEEKIERILNNTITEKKKENFEDYDLIEQIMAEQSMDLSELQNAGVNLSIFNMGMRGEKGSDKKPRNIWY